MFLLGTFIRRNFDPDAQQDIIDDIDFFAFPAVNEEHGQDAVEAPIDGFMMAAQPANEEGAKALLAGMGGVAAIDAYIAVNPSVVAANVGADTSGYNALQQKSVELVGAATFIAQFLDRDTDPGLRRQRRRRRPRRLHLRPEPDRLDPQHGRRAEADVHVRVS